MTVGKADRSSVGLQGGTSARVDVGSWVSPVNRTGWVWISKKKASACSFREGHFQETGSRDAEGVSSLNCLGGSGYLSYVCV